ncbi:hypothetical protein HK102_004756, partial [Quaeritorhiza haematococci]
MEALCLYEKAFKASTSKDESSSASKNLGMASLRISRTFDPSSNETAYYLKLQHFSKAIDSSFSSKSDSWRSNLESFIKEAVAEALSDLQILSNNTKKLSFLRSLCSVRCPRTGSLSSALSVLLFANALECMAAEYMNMAFSFLYESQQHAEQAFSTRYAGWNEGDEEAKEEAEDHLETVLQSVPRFESVRARKEAEVRLKLLLSNTMSGGDDEDEDGKDTDDQDDDEDGAELQLDEHKIFEAWAVADVLKFAMSVIRGSDFENEALAAFALGRLFDKVVKMYDRARASYVVVLQLAEAMKISETYLNEFKGK